MCCHLSSSLEFHTGTQQNVSQCYLSKLKASLQMFFLQNIHYFLYLVCSLLIHDDIAWDLPQDICSVHQYRNTMELMCSKILSIAYFFPMTGLWLWLSSSYCGFPLQGKRCPSLFFKNTHTEENTYNQIFFITYGFSEFPWQGKSSFGMGMIKTEGKWCCHIQPLWSIHSKTIQYEVSQHMYMTTSCFLKKEN